MRGMAFTLIAEIVIGVASLIVLLMLFTPLPQTLSEGYCFLHAGFVSVMPFPEGMKPAMPDFCTTETVHAFERVRINENDIETISTRIVSYALACLKISGDATSDDDIVCYELHIPDINGYVEFIDITEKIPKEYSSKIVWRAGTLHSDTVLAVHYDSNAKLVVIE